MDKEKLITVVIGLVVGIAAAGGYFVITKYLPTVQNKVTFNPQQANNPQPDNSANKLAIDLAGPEDHSSTSEANLVISGKTLAGSRLVFFANSDEKIASADAAGKFSVNLKLEEGENTISVSAFDNTGNIVIVKRNVTLEITQ